MCTVDYGQERLFKQRLCGRCLKNNRDIGDGGKDYKAKMFKSKMGQGRGRFLVWFGYL
jgi:hypothetical protein